jgi:hypothetical protein
VFKKDDAVPLTEDGPGAGAGAGALGLADVALTVGTDVALALGLTEAALTVGTGVALALGLTVAANLRPVAADVTAKAAAEVATLTEAKETLPAFKREEAAAW